MHLLGGRLDKKEADVDRKTRATKELEGNSKPSASRANQTPQRGGFAPRQSSAGGRAAGVSMSAGGGFAPAGVAKQASLRTALSPQQVAAINLRKGYWQDYQRAIQARRRREEAQARERMARLSREAYLSGADCDDSDPEIHPGLLEVCDGKDNNCDGNVDEGTTILAYADLDGDMHGDASTAQEVCPSDITAAQREGRWLSTVGNDCDDQDPDQWNDCRTGGSSE
ncbi:MAG TPA: hypothetical protein ENI97_15510 [Gammaproteobacteria bacterium]|nr:hypothetical protein [Gammaproteobacteria bacterium]